MNGSWEGKLLAGVPKAVEAELELHRGNKPPQNEQSAGAAVGYLVWVFGRVKVDAVQLLRSEASGERVLLAGGPEDQKPYELGQGAPEGA